MFSAPIPGQSLTSEPKNSPWENPPQFVEPEEALMFHMKRLEEPKKIKSILGLLELGLDVVTMTEGILRGGVAEGRHSIDVSLLLGPIIHEYITGVADAAGIDYEEGLEDDEAFEKDLSYSVREKKAQVILDEYKKTGDVVDISSVEESVPDEPMEKEEPEPMGLMSRRTV